MLKRPKQLLTGKAPFIDKYQSDLWFLSALIASELKIEDAYLPESTPPELVEIINRCITPSPEHRPSTFEVYTSMGQIAGKRALMGVMKDGYS